MIWDWGISFNEVFCIVNSNCDNYLISFTTNNGVCDYEK